MQGDVLSPLISSNMVDKYVGKRAFKTGNIYIYKNSVEIPPLAMQDDTLGISECGIKTTSMTSFLNTQTNLMHLQFGNKKCVKMHIGNTQNIDIYSDLAVDAWSEELGDGANERHIVNDKYEGRKV